MKIKTLFVIILSLTLIAQACRKKDQTLEQRTGLPAATQTGMNTFGALVNDELVESKKRWFSYGSPLKAGYEFLLGGSRTVFVIRATDLVSPNYKGIVLAIDTSITQGMVYTFYKKQDTLLTNYFTYNKDRDLVKYTINPPLKGQLTITRYDPSARIISGTFFFDAINLKGEKVFVTDGRFDVQY